jgi:hypothetical protein
MYGFTSVFPWFGATCDSITVAAHPVLGASAAAVYKMLGQLQYAQPHGATSDRQQEPAA